MSLREKFGQLVESAQGTVEYWRDVAITDFTRDLHERMRRMNVTHAELARRMGTSRPYVTKLLDGSNFTLETMVKLATALGGVVRVHVADRDALTHWKDESVSEEGHSPNDRPPACAYKLVRCEGGGFVASDPDLPGYIAQGDTADEAIKALDRIRRSCSEGRFDDQLPRPEPAVRERKSRGSGRAIEDQPRP